MAEATITTTAAAAPARGAAGGNGRKLAAVVRREFLERVRTRWFLVSTLLGPVFFAARLVCGALSADPFESVNDVHIVQPGSDSPCAPVRGPDARTG